MRVRSTGALAAMMLLACLSLLAANLRLYLKDGSYQLVREYQVEGDRVRFYSIERSEWEEIPADLVDLKRTETEVRERQESIEQEAKVLTEEDQAERRQREEVARVPQNPGVYLIDGESLIPIKRAEPKIVTNTSRSILKVLTPIPVVPGQATVEIDGEHSANIVKVPAPEFYFRLDLPERLAIFRLSTKKNARVVQKWNILPKTNEILEDQEEVQVFRRQLEDDLYKIWPMGPLKPGEYAVVEYTAGQRNIQAWDFAYAAVAK
jgi:hypothetical protein